MRLLGMAVALALATVAVACGGGTGPAGSCCVHCKTGCACGDSCISCSSTCRVGAGCACNGEAPSEAEESMSVAPGGQK